MNTLLNIVILLVGFVLLIKGADFFVEGSAAVARKMLVPSVIIGLTIVAFGTSAPEMAVSISAALQGSNEIAVSNVIGSNMFNLLVVLGACAVMAPVPCDKEIVNRDFSFMNIITAVLIILVFGGFMTVSVEYGLNSSEECSILSRIDGIVLLCLFVFYLSYTVKAALKSRNKDEEPTKVFLKVWEILLYIFGGLAAIIAGGQLVVNSAKAIALAAGMSETLVGLTIVAVGTSLPELVTSIVAAKKGENGLAVGNVIGSNIFNILFILGVSSAIMPIPVTVQSVMDSILLVAMCFIVFLFAKTRESINKKEGLLMILVYIAYMGYAIVR